MEQSYLYVIASSPDGPVKLGISNNPDRRLKQLQTGHAEMLQIFHTAPVPADQARHYESVLHRTINYMRRRGEWFDVPVKDAINYLELVFIEHEPSELVP